MPVTARQRNFLENLYKISAINKSRVVIEEERRESSLYKYHFVHPNFGQCYAFIDEDGDLKIKKGTAAVELLREDDPLVTEVITHRSSTKLSDLSANKRDFFSEGSLDVSPRSSEAESRVKRNKGLSRSFVAAAGGTGRNALGRQDGFKVVHFFSYEGTDYQSFTVGKDGTIKSLHNFSGGLDSVLHGTIEVIPEITEKFQEGCRVVKLRNELEYADDAFVSADATTTDAQIVNVNFPPQTFSKGAFIVTIVGIAEKKYRAPDVAGHMADSEEVVFVDDKGNKVRLEVLAALMTDEQVDAFIGIVRAAIDRIRPPKVSAAAVRPSTAASTPTAPARSAATSPLSVSPIATHELVLQHVRDQFGGSKKVAMMPMGGGTPPVGFYTAEDFRDKSFSPTTEDDTVVLFGGNPAHVVNPGPDAGGDGQAAAAGSYGNPDAEGTFAFPITTQGPGDLFSDFDREGSLGKRMIAAEIAVLKKAIDAGARIVIPTDNEGNPSMPGALSHAVFARGKSESATAVKGMIKSLAAHPAPAADTDGVEAVASLRDFVAARAEFFRKHPNCMAEFCTFIEDNSPTATLDQLCTSLQFMNSVDLIALPAPAPAAAPAGRARNPLILHELVREVIKGSSPDAGNVISDADKASLIEAFRENQDLIKVVDTHGKTPLDLLAEFAATLPLDSENKSPLIEEVLRDADVLNLKPAIDLRPEVRSLAHGSAERKIQIQIEDLYRSLRIAKEIGFRQEFERLATKAAGEEEAKATTFDSAKFEAILKVYPEFGQQLLRNAFEENIELKEEALNALTRNGVKLAEILIFYASNGENNEILKLLESPLLEFVDLNGYSSDAEYLHNTTLHLLAAKNWGRTNSAGLELSETSAQIAARLIAAGANPNLKNTKGHTALDVAIARRDMAMVQAICNSGKVTEKTIEKALATLEAVSDRLTAMKLVTTECLVIADLEGATTAKMIEDSFDYQDQCNPLLAEDFDAVTGVRKKEELLSFLNGKLREMTGAAVSSSVVAPSAAPRSALGAMVAASRGSAVSSPASTLAAAAPLPTATPLPATKRARIMRADEVPEAGKFKGFIAAVRADEARGVAGVTPEQALAKRRVLIDPIASDFVAEEAPKQDRTNKRTADFLGKVRAKAALRDGFRVVRSAAASGNIDETNPISFAAPSGAIPAGYSVVAEVEAKEIEECRGSVQIFYDEEKITPDEIHDIMLIKAGKDVQHCPVGTDLEKYRKDLTSKSPYLLYRFESRQTFEMDPSGVRVLDEGSKKAERRPFYYNHLPSLQTGAPDWEYFTNKVSGNAALLPEKKEELKAKYCSAIKLQLLAAAANEEGCFILEPNAFLFGLNRDGQTEAKKLYLEAAIQALTEFQTTQLALASRLGKVFLQSSAATATTDLSAITEIDFTITSGMDAAFPHASRGRGEKAVAQPVMGDALGPVGNGALGNAAASAAEENLCRQMPMMLCVIAPQNHENLMEESFLLDHSKTLSSVLTDIAASASPPTAAVSSGVSSSAAVSLSAATSTVAAPTQGELEELFNRLNRVCNKYSTGFGSVPFITVMDGGSRQSYGIKFTPGIGLGAAPVFTPVKYAVLPGISAGSFEDVAPDQVGAVLKILSTEVQKSEERVAGVFAALASPENGFTLNADSSVSGLIRHTANPHGYGVRLAAASTADKPVYEVVQRVFSNGISMTVTFPIATAASNVISEIEKDISIGFLNGTVPLADGCATLQQLFARVVLDNIDLVREKSAEAGSALEFDVVPGGVAGAKRHIDLCFNLTGRTERYYVDFNNSSGGPAVFDIYSSNDGSNFTKITDDNEIERTLRLFAGEVGIDADSLMVNFHRAKALREATSAAAALASIPARSATGDTSVASSPASLPASAKPVVVSSTPTPPSTAGASKAPASAASASLPASAKPVVVSSTPTPPPPPPGGGVSTAPASKAASASLPASKPSVVVSSTPTPPSTSGVSTAPASKPVVTSSPSALPASRAAPSVAGRASKPPAKPALVSGARSVSSVIDEWAQEAGEHKIPSSSVKAIMYMPLVSEKIQVVGRADVKNALYADKKTRGGKFRVIDGVYKDSSPEDRQEAIENMFINIIAVAAKDCGLTSDQVLKAISLAKEQGGVAHKKAGGKYSDVSASVDLQIAAFSARFQELAADCGFYTGHSSTKKAVGSRLAYLPEEVIKLIGDATSLPDVNTARREIKAIKDSITAYQGSNPAIRQVPGGRT